VNLHALLVGKQTGAATMETLLGFLKNLKVELAYNPAFLFLGMYLKEMKSLSGKGICIPLFIIAFLQ